MFDLDIWQEDADFINNILKHEILVEKCVRASQY